MCTPILHVPSPSSLVFIGLTYCSLFLICCMPSSLLLCLFLSSVVPLTPLSPHFLHCPLIFHADHLSSPPLSPYLLAIVSYSSPLPLHLLLCCPLPIPSDPPLFLHCPIISFHPLLFCPLSPLLLPFISSFFPVPSSTDH